MGTRIWALAFCLLLVVGCTSDNDVKVSKALETKNKAIETENKVVEEFEHLMNNYGYFRDNDYDEFERMWTNMANLATNTNSIKEFSVFLSVAPLIQGSHTQEEFGMVVEQRALSNCRLYFEARELLSETEKKSLDGFAASPITMPPEDFKKILDDCTTKQ